MGSLRWQLAADADGRWRQWWLGLRPGDHPAQHQLRCLRLSGRLYRLDQQGADRAVCLRPCLRHAHRAGCRSAAFLAMAVPMAMDLYLAMAVWPTDLVIDRSRRLCAGWP